MSGVSNLGGAGGGVSSGGISFGDAWLMTSFEPGLLGNSTDALDVEGGGLFLRRRGPLDGNEEVGTEYQGSWATLVHRLILEVQICSQISENKGYSR